MQQSQPCSYVTTDVNKIIMWLFWTILLLFIVYVPIKQNIII